MDKLFIHIPKPAGVAINTSLTNNEVMFEDFGHEKLIDIEKKIDLQNFKIFTFVRNPYDRLYSSYHFHLQKSYACKIVKEKLLKYGSFENFVLDLENFIISNQNEQFHFQKDFISSSKSNIGFIGRFENIDKDWNKLLQYLEIIEKEPLVVMNNTIHEDYKKIYSEKMKDIIYDIYNVDFEFFDYKK